MALAIAHSRGLDGLNAPPVIVETHLASGLPSFALVGLPDTEVKEARDRVRAAIANSGFDFPSKRITVNLAPADLPKESGRFDLPIALGILAASGQIDPAQLVGHEFAGELSLSGELRPVRGALSNCCRCSEWLPSQIGRHRACLDRLRRQACDRIHAFQAKTRSARRACTLGSNTTRRTSVRAWTYRIAQPKRSTTSTMSVPLRHLPHSL